MWQPNRRRWEATGYPRCFPQTFWLWLRPVRHWVTKSCKHPTCKSPLLPPTLAVKFPSAELLLDSPHLKCLYLRTTCSDTLMLRDRKASTAEDSFSSFTGGELFKPCFAFLASLKLLGGEAPSPKRGHRKGGNHCRDVGWKVTGHRVNIGGSRRVM